MATPCMCLCLLIFLLPHFLTISMATLQDDLIIDTKHGKVQGKVLSVLGGDVRAFLGIPYGKPPLDTLRFSAPEPVEKWQGVMDATKFPNTCYQLPDEAFPGFKGSEMWNPNTPMSEDCLYLNVWTPRFNKTQSKTSPLAPVLVWIYGGGFNQGTSSLDVYDGRFLSKSEGVVVVSMNYRVGAFGFLSIPDNSNFHSNMGLLDQRLALQWVAKNIPAFGGDPTMVTLFGNSAGSASVGFHLLSPGSHSLFKRAVMQSGSPNAPWATISQNECWRRSMKLVTLLGCPQSPPVDMEACLKMADPLEISSKQYDVSIQPNVLDLPFAPHVDGTFLPDKIEVLLNRVPNKEVLLGLNKDEGTYFTVYSFSGFNITDQSLITRNDFLKGVAKMLPESHIARDVAISQYTDWTDENNGMKNRNSLASQLGDQQFACPLLEFAHRYSQSGGKAFFYSFEHQSSVNPWPEWMGVMHGYEIEFVFGMPLNTSLKYTRNEVNMTKKILKHWGNFARTGNPGIDGVNWPVFTNEEQEYVTLNYNDPVPKKMMKAKECHLWSILMPKVQKVSDDLLFCVTANGIMLCSNYTFLLIILAIILTYW